MEISIKKWNWKIIFISVYAIMTQINTSINFYKNISSMSLSFEIIQNIAQITFPIIVVYFVWKLYSLEKIFKQEKLVLEKNQKKQNEDDEIMANSIMRLRDEKTTLQIMCQCLIEEATKYAISNSDNIKNPIIDSKAQQEKIKENAMKKMNQVFDETKTNPEKRNLIDSIWNIQPDKKI